MLLKKCVEMLEQTLTCLTLDLKEVYTREEELILPS